MRAKRRDKTRLRKCVYCWRTVPTRRGYLVAHNTRDPKKLGPEGKVRCPMSGKHWKRPGPITYRPRESQQHGNATEKCGAGIIPQNRGSEP